jgi:uncharacterized protein YdhG (YjbR/CyaY superfamily)
MIERPSSVHEYLAGLSEDKRAALEKLRQSIKAAAPRSEECFSYGMPAFRLNGRMLVYFHGAKNHCSFFPGAFPLVVCKKEVEHYDTSKGTIRFPIDKPLPSALVRKLVKARIAEGNAKRKSPLKK